MPCRTASAAISTCPTACNAALVEHVVAFNYSAAPERFKVIAETFGIDCRGLTQGRSASAWWTT